MLLLVGISFTSCSHYRFIKTDTTQETFLKREKKCPIAVLTEFPTDKKYVQLGLCNGTAPGGGIISDKTHKAINQLKKCACANGGNTIVLQDVKEEGYVMSGFGYSQQSAKARAYILYVYP